MAVNLSSDSFNKISDGKVIPSLLPLKTLLRVMKLKR